MGAKPTMHEGRRVSLGTCSSEEVTTVTWSLGDKVGALGLREPVVAGADDSLRSAAYTLWRENVGALVVRDGGTVPSGILSERDVVARAAHGDDLDAVTVGEAMSTHVIAARIGDTAHDVAYQMLEHGIRHLPVVDDEGRLVGLVSIRDVLRPVVARDSLPPPG